MNEPLSSEDVNEEIASGNKILEAFENDYGPFLSGMMNGEFLDEEIQLQYKIYQHGWDAHQESKEEFDTAVKRLLLDMVEHISTTGNLINNQSDLYDEMTRLMADHNIRGMR